MVEVGARFIARNRALIAERDYVEALARAKSTEDPLEARVYRAEAEEFANAER